MQSTALFVLSFAAALVAGITPSGFTPASNADLMVVYGEVAATNGVVVDRASTANEPALATKAQLSGTSYAVIMVDLDIPSTQNPHTFLHWMQTGLTPATAASTMTTASGTLQGFSLINAQNTSAIVAYTQPAPPAQNPLSHRYTEVLVDTSALSVDGLTVLQTAAKSRVGFDIKIVLQSAGLIESVVAVNSFNVTNPGPVAAYTAANYGSQGNGKAAKNGTEKATEDGGEGDDSAEKQAGEMGNGYKGNGGGQKEANNGDQDDGEQKKGGKSGSEDGGKQEKGGNSGSEDGGEQEKGGKSGSEDGGEQGKGGKNGGGDDGEYQEGAKKSGTTTGSWAKATAAANGNGTQAGNNGAKATGAATATLPSAANPAGMLASVRPTASGSPSNGSFANIGASGRNGTGIVTTSGAITGYILDPVSLLVGLTGALFWAF